MTVVFNILEKAIQIATNAHDGQTDKGGKPYILHPLKVMSNVNSEEEKIVAVLHDVVEDTDITFADLAKEGIPTICIEALILLTHPKEVSYMDYIQGISTNDLARIVKIADLRDNSDLTRLSSISQRDIKRVEKYAKALSILEQSNDFP